MKHQRYPEENRRIVCIRARKKRMLKRAEAGRNPPIRQSVGTKRQKGVVKPPPTQEKPKKGGLEEKPTWRKRCGGGGGDSARKTKRGKTDTEPKVATSVEQWRGVSSQGTGGTRGAS